MPPEQRRWHFGVLSFTGKGHLHPLLALSQELKKRGHRITFFEKPKVEDWVRQAGLEFFPIAGQSSRSLHIKPPAGNAGTWSEMSTLRFNLKRIANDLETFLQETPPALERAGVDALLINEIALTGPTVAQILRLPYFIISTSVPHNFGWNAYPWRSGYQYTTSWFAHLENALLEVSSLRMRGPLRHALDRYRRKVGLSSVGELQNIFPALAQITQLPQCLDLPRASLPRNFHYTGPFVSETVRSSIDFPWHRLDGRPVVYASLGTTRNVQAFLFRLIAAACVGLDTQLVISLGGRFDPELFSDLPGDPLMTKYAPQLDLLKIAKIVITHAGPNTVFETLREGKPMVAIPIAHDQPAIAFRLARLGLAEVLSIKGLSANRIRTAVTNVLNDPRYGNAAREIQVKIRSIRGCERAADIIERALNSYSSGSPRTLLRQNCGATDAKIPAHPNALSFRLS